MESKMKQFFEDLSIEIKESYGELQRISRHISKELDNVNATMASEMDAIKKIELLESQMQTLVRYKNQYQEEARLLDWNQNMYKKLKESQSENQ